MYTVVSVLIIIGAIFLILAVLLQPGKGDLTSTFGGISTQFGQVFGMHRAKTMLSKVTKIIAAIIFILVILTNKFLVGKEEAQQKKAVTEDVKVPANMQGTMKPPPVPMPGQAQPK